MDGPAPLLMIPGPVEVSPAVREAYAGPPPGHLAPRLIEAFGAALAAMRRVWLAPESAQPFVVAGGGTVAMEMAAANLVAPGDAVVVVKTGYFSDRMVEMLRRQGGRVLEVEASPGDAPTPEAVGRAVETYPGKTPVKALFATHVDTSTGVRVDPEPLARLARERGLLSVFDGVCATGGERFAMADWGADLYLTASQKALGLPPGLALLVAGERALEVRARRTAEQPPMYLDFEQWRPVMAAYEERRPSYFSTPATNLVLALEAGLGEILAAGVEERFARHARAAAALAAAWEVLGLEPIPRRELRAHTLSVLRFPAGVDAALVGAILEHGVAVAGGLHPAIRATSFRIGHMGYAVTRRDYLLRTVEAVASALGDLGRPADVATAVDAAASRL